MRKTDMETAKLYITSTEKTFQYDDDLPSLPLPPLHETLQKYLESVRPHVAVDEYEKTKNIVNNFENGIGAVLYQKLSDRAKNSKNWMEIWWEKEAYLEIRTPLTPVNFGGAAPYMYHYLPPQDGVQLGVAGLVIYYHLKYWQLLRREQLKPDRDRKGRVLSMHQYYKLFNTCRIPGVKTDSMEYYFRTESEGKSPVHLVVMYNGKVFTFDAVDDHDEIISPLELTRQLAYIKETCDSMPEGPAIGSLTSDGRTPWANVRARLLSLHPDNRVALETVQSALFVVVLDDACPTDETDIMQELLAGQCKNKWFDKSFSLIFYKNGVTSFNCEHTSIDGMVVASATHFVHLCIMECKGKWQGSQSIREMSNPKEIVFHIDEDIQRGISMAQEEYLTFANNLECFCLKFKKFGKSFLRDHKVHPDAFVQMALQFAYYRKYGSPTPTYESATTRRFWHARTETVRSCTMEAIAWIKAMQDVTLSEEIKLQLFTKAVNKHLNLMEKATENHGCDRLLLGLSMQAQEGGLKTQDIFLDPVYMKSGGGGNFKLSTSFAGYTPTFGACAPMCTDGYGVFYNIEASQIVTVMTAWKSDVSTSASEFNHLLHQTLGEMGSMLENTGIVNSHE